MKKTTIIFLMILITYFCQAEDKKENTIADTSSNWKKGGYTSLLFNQISFSNWVQGGENSFSATGIIALFANLKLNKFAWDNTLDFKYGLQRTDEYGYRTNQDIIDLNTKLGYQALESIFYSGLINFKSQFASGYNYPNDSLIVSKFMAPAYLIVSLGLDYKPDDRFTIYVSPMTGKFIFVNDTEIANRGTYTAEPAIFDNDGNIIKSGNDLRADFGAYIRASLKIELMENITLDSKIELFNNYTDKIIKNRGNIDVNSETTIVMTINEFISANFFLHLIYDHDIKVPLYQKVDGIKTLIGTGPRLQFKEVLGIGISYSFK